jgi:hypothetical protein
MKQMGFDLLRIFLCYFLFKRGGRSWIRVGFMSQERLERVGDPGGSPGSKNAQKSKFLELDETNSIATGSLH